jgi:hypothetical protein
MKTNKLSKEDREKIEQAAILFACNIRKIRVDRRDFANSEIIWQEGFKPDNYILHKMQVFKEFGLSDKDSLGHVYKAHWRWLLGYYGTLADDAPEEVIKAFEAVAEYLHEIVLSPDGDPGKAIMRFKDKSPSDDPVLKANIGIILDFAQDKQHALEIFRGMIGYARAGFVDVPFANLFAGNGTLQ